MGGKLHQTFSFGYTRQNPPAKGYLQSHAADQQNPVGDRRYSLNESSADLIPFSYIHQIPIL